MDAQVSLFDNGREATITSTIAMVEDALIELGHFLNECRDPPTPAGQRSWRVAKGSALVRISLVERDDTEPNLRVVSVVMTLDDRVDDRQLFRYLLTLNARSITGAAFGLDGHQVVLLAERSTLNLDRSEVLDLIRRVEDYADEYDDRLVVEFGGVLGTGI